MSDTVNHPPHYMRGTIETIDVIESFGLGFHLGNVVKYVLRSFYKGDRLGDLRKARWYLDREIARSEKQVERVSGASLQSHADKSFAHSLTELERSLSPADKSFAHELGPELVAYERLQQQQGDRK